MTTTLEKANQAGAYLSVSGRKLYNFPSDFKIEHQPPGAHQDSECPAAVHSIIRLSLKFLEKKQAVSKSIILLKLLVFLHGDNIYESYLVAGMHRCRA